MASSCAAAHKARRRRHPPVRALERLQQSLIEGLKAFEFALRRQVETNGGTRPVLGASGDVPAGFRQMPKALAAARRLAGRSPQ